MLVFIRLCVLFFFKQKTAYEMRISDWSSDVCSSDLLVEVSTRTTSRRDAIAFLRDFIPAKREQLLAERGRARQGAPRTFAAVAMAYAAAIGLSRVNRAKLEIGRASCRERVCQYV